MEFENDCVFNTFDSSTQGKFLSTESTNRVLVDPGLYRKPCPKCCAVELNRRPYSWEASFLTTFWENVCKESIIAG